jgi:hypothetical protein
MSSLNRRRFLASTALGAATLAAPSVLRAQGQPIKVGFLQPTSGAMSYSGQQGRIGATLALDFPNQGQRTFDLLDRLDAITMAAEGALYPAKDARMSGDTFRRSFPNWQQLEPFIDPRFSSSFWRRVTGESQ